MEPHYLYKITNLVNGKAYIGVTKDPVLRKRQHLTKNIDKLLTRAINKYGKDSFLFEVLVCGSQEYIYAIEESAIELYNTHAVRGNGYNIADGGRGGSKPRRGKVETRVDDKCVYVAGFWFPNRRTATASLNWTTSKFRYRRDKGVLGETHLPEFSSARNSMKAVPCYYRGFWFKNITQACVVFNVHADNIKKDLRCRRHEQSDEIQNYKIIRKPYVFQCRYESHKEAAEALGISVIALKGRYDRKDDPENYSFTYIKEDLS